MKGCGGGYGVKLTPPGKTTLKKPNLYRVKTGSSSICSIQKEIKLEMDFETDYSNKRKKSI